jgi:hypothetical protein
MIKDPTLMIPFTAYKNNVDEAEQAMFEACCKLICEHCKNGKPTKRGSYGQLIHKVGVVRGAMCDAEQLRCAFPERSARLDAPRA